MILSARSSRLVNSPRRSTFRVRIENQISTMFSQDAWVGVWWTWNRGWARSHALVTLEVWLDPLSMTRWMSRWWGTAWSISVRNLMNVTESFRSMTLPKTVPSTTFIAAINETVPWRRYSNSRRVARPGATAMEGYLRDLAWIPVFSSMLSSTASGGGLRYNWQISFALAKNAGSGGRFSQPRTRCGLTSSSPRIRPT